MNDSERPSATERRDPSTSEALGAPATARRRLVRGVFALPALATVHSGSALANGSSLRCLVNPSYTTLPGVLYTARTDPDQYRRVQLGALIPNGSDKTPSAYYLDGNNVHDAEPGATFIAANNWQLYDVTSNQATGVVLTTEPSGNGNSASYTRTSGAWAVLVYDAQGHVVGVGVVSGTNYATTGSCWGSFTKTLQG